MNRFPSRLATLMLLFSGASALAQVPSVPEPTGINLGATSFYDGFSGPPGLAWLTTAKVASADRIKDNQGHDVAVFTHPKIDSVVWANQVSYAYATSIGGWRPQVTAILPLVSIDSSFGAGASLKDSGTGLGDITVGVGLQSDPVVGPTGHPLFVQRFELDGIIPTGKYERSSDINPGAGFGSINPYWAASLFPAERWELSWRLHYLYNLRNNKPAASSPVPYLGSVVANTQAGQAAWINFTASYSVTPDVSVGINGYFFDQLTDSKANGGAIPDARERVLGIGPGMMWRIRPTMALWLNTYTETQVRNRPGTPFAAQARMAINF